MKGILGLLLGVLVLLAVSGFGAQAHEVRPLQVFQNGCYYPGTCIRTWGNCPTVSLCNGDIYLGTNSATCEPATVGFGIFANCSVNLSDFNELEFNAQLLVRGDVPNKCAIFVKIELQDDRGQKANTYLWIIPGCHDYHIPLARFRCINLCKITGLFLLTAFDLIRYDDSRQTLLVFDYIRFVHEECYTVFDNCSDLQIEGQYNGPLNLFHWPDCGKVIPLISKSDPRFDRVLIVPCNVWGAGFLGFSVHLGDYKFLTFWLLSSVQVKIEVADDCGNKVAFCLASTNGCWAQQKICLTQFPGVDFSRLTWQFMITKIGRDDNEVRVAEVRYCCV